jgi:hypothetical protein
LFVQIIYSFFKKIQNPGNRQNLFLVIVSKKKSPPAVCYALPIKNKGKAVQQFFGNLWGENPVMYRGFPKTSFFGKYSIFCSLYKNVMGSTVASETSDG